MPNSGGSVPSNVLGKGLATTLLCSAAMFSGCGGKGAAPAPDTTFGGGTASGNHAAAQAGGSTDSFKTLAIHVAAAPNQRVTGSWSIACRIGDGEMAAHDGETFTGRTPLTVQVRPVVTAVPTKCTAVASATLARSGRVTLQLLGG